MKKKPVFNLDKEEKDLSDSFDKGEWKSVKNVAKEKAKARAASANYLRKMQRIKHKYAAGT